MEFYSPVCPLVTLKAHFENLSSMMGCWPERQTRQKGETMLGYELFVVLKNQVPMY